MKRIAAIIVPAVIIAPLCLRALAAEDGGRSEYTDGSYTGWYGENLSKDEWDGWLTWHYWSAGDHRLWDWVARNFYGLADLLKTLDTRKRGERFETMGLINQPGFRKADRPDEFGLWLDAPAEGYEEDLEEVYFRDLENRLREYLSRPGFDETSLSAEERTLLALKKKGEEIWGRPSGVVGLRLFKNPDFGPEARAKWNADRYYNDPGYYRDPNLVRPYRVGVQCSVCHVAFNPVNPPADPEAPLWENLAPAIGNQYLREMRVFAHNTFFDPNLATYYDMESNSQNLLYQLFDAQPPGTSDTSRIATDHINNPNAINAIFNLGARLDVAEPEIQNNGIPAPVPHILKDGADSIGVAGASIRVYVNIGLFSEYWLTLFDPLIGLTPQKPFDTLYANQASPHWRATAARLVNAEKYLKTIGPFKLANAPGGGEFLNNDEEVLTRGKLAFANNCARCHSSKRPPAAIAGDAEKSRAWFREAVMRPDFLDNNFLSDDRRYPVTEIQTNSARALATNAQQGHVWHNFSSWTYKTQPAVGIIEATNPFDPGTPITFASYSPGVGYYRTPSLVSIWTSAPFFHNNGLGIYTGDPSVEGRMKAFNDAAEKLFWPGKRGGLGSVWRTTETSFLVIPADALENELGQLSPAVQKFLSLYHKLHHVYQKAKSKFAILKRIFGFGGEGGMDGGKVKNIIIGPVPAGTPINLLFTYDQERLLEMLPKLIEAYFKVHESSMTEEQAVKYLTDTIVPLLIESSPCPDFVEDRGHYFAEGLDDADKRALIEYMKYF